MSMFERRKADDWFNAKTTDAIGRSCSHPFENIHIGQDPLHGMTREDAHQYHAIVSVSDQECALFHPSRPSQRTYWIPTNEMGVWNYSSFVHFIKIMEFHHNQGHKIYVHCAAGLYRSPTMVMIWLRNTQTVPYKKGKQDFRIQMSWEEANRVALGCTKEKYKEWFKDSKRTSKDRFIDNMPKGFNYFMARLRQNHDHEYAYYESIGMTSTPVSKDMEIRGNLQGWKTSEKIKRPFNWIKYRYQELKEWSKLLLKGQKQVYIAEHHRTTIDGDGWFRTLIRWMRGIK